MSWLFVLIIIGTGGVAFEHAPAVSQAQCVGLEPMKRADWLSGRKAVTGLGEIVKFRSVCTVLPADLDPEHVVVRPDRPKPATVHRPTVGLVPVPSNGTFRETFPLSRQPVLF